MLKYFYFFFFNFLSFVFEFSENGNGKYHHELNLFKLIQFIIRFVSFYSIILFYYTINIFLEVIISKVGAYVKI